jgi:quercetin dioxygenase-like cupin family protein
MRLKIKTGLLVMGLVGTLGLALPASAQNAVGRQEISRVDLTGAPGMEVVTSIGEYPKGEWLVKHLHHGIESAYVIQGGWVQAPGKEPMELKTGTALLNLRDAVHAGFVVVSDTPIKLFTVHVVDKGKPLYDTAVK